MLYYSRTMNGLVLARCLHKTPNETGKKVELQYFVAIVAIVVMLNNFVGDSSTLQHRLGRWAILHKLQII